MSVQAPVRAPADLLAQVAATADDRDRDGISTRDLVARIAGSGLASLGAPANADGRLPEQAALVGDLAGACLSTAFSLWAHRMTVEYLRAASTPWSVEAAARLERGEAMGVTGMASAFKNVAGCGDLDLRAIRTTGGWSLSGTLRWASNLHPDSVMVTAALTNEGHRLVVGLGLDTPGVRLGAPFALLAMEGTDSSVVELADVEVDDAQVLTEDVESFLSNVRPTFLVLQTALCLGLAERCLAQARGSLSGVNISLAPQVDATAERWADADRRLHAYATAVGREDAPSPRQLLQLRIDAADLAVTAAGHEVRTAGGRGYARRTDVSRRFREAAFLPVQSPSETQLRWELSRMDA